MSGIPLHQVDWWTVRPGPETPPDPESCTCWWTRGEDGQAECGDDSCRCHEHCEQETPMSEWTGLHHPDRHTVEASGLTSCHGCADTGCSTSAPCRCCLAQEVERLTDQVDAVRRVLAESQTDLVAELREQIEAALRGEDEWTIEAERGEQ